MHHRRAVAARGGRPDAAGPHAVLTSPALLELIFANFDAREDWAAVRATCTMWRSVADAEGSSAWRKLHLSSLDNIAGAADKSTCLGLVRARAGVRQLVLSTGSHYGTSFAPALVRDCGGSLEGLMLNLSCLTARRAAAQPLSL